MWRTDIGHVGRQRWTHNLREWHEYGDAELFGVMLLRSWDGADVARVVPAELPKNQPINMRDPNIIVSYRD